MPTVYRLTGELLRQVLLLEGPLRRGGLGKPPLELSVNPEGAYSIGFNFDRDVLVGVLTDLTGTMLSRVRAELVTSEPEEFLHSSRTRQRRSRAIRPSSRSG